MKTIRNLLVSIAVALCGSILPSWAQTDAGTGVAGVRDLLMFTSLWATL